MEKEIQRKTIFRLWDLIELGVSLRRMHHAQEDWPTRESDTFAGLEPFAIECLNDFVSVLREISIKDTKGRLSRCLAELEKMLTKWDKNGWRNVDGDTKALLEIARQIEGHLTAIAADYVAFVPTELGDQARRYVEEIENEIGHEVFSQLPPIAQRDFREAGRCMALEAYTAAACLMVRATEAVLRCYYCAITSEEAPRKGMWGPVVNSLIDKANNGEISVSQQTAHFHDFLRTLGSVVRNPTMHPQEFYDLSKARHLLEKCREAINGMASSLDRQGKKNIYDGWPLASKTMQIES